MHNHLCETCKQPVAICGTDECTQPGEHYCSVHHPDPEHRKSDPPNVRMTVATVPAAVVK